MTTDPIPPRIRTWIRQASTTPAAHDAVADIKAIIRAGIGPDESVVDLAALVDLDVHIIRGRE